jgi:cytochrome c oxidase subunit 2
VIKRGMLMLAVGTLALLAACGSQDDGPEPTVTRNPNVTNVPQPAVTTAPGTAETSPASPAPASPAPDETSPAATAAGSPTGAAASPTSASTEPAAIPEGNVERGKAAAAVCLGCHSVDGNTSVGPTWKGLYGKTEELESGETVTVDAAYIHESIVDPNAKIVKGYPPAMPPFAYLTEEQIADIIAYIESLKD